jgi:hypothetical protein
MLGQPRSSFNFQLDFVYDRHYRHHFLNNMGHDCSRRSFERWKSPNAVHRDPSVSHVWKHTWSFQKYHPSELTKLPLGLSPLFISTVFFLLSTEFLSTSESCIKHGQLRGNSSAVQNQPNLNTSISHSSHSELEESNEGDPVWYFPRVKSSA